jgi:ribosomal protein S18 acetylase RimI-like enzyme
LQRAFYRDEKYPYDAAAAEKAVRDLIANPSLGALFVVTEPERVEAYLVITFGYSLEFGGRDAFVDELYVAPTARKKGLGTSALDVAEQVCREAGVRALHLEVERTNLGAKSLYEKRGFYEHSRHLMTKLLDVPPRKKKE